MPETLTPREVFTRLLDNIAAGRYPELAGLYAKDAVVETVFEPVGPRRTQGRSALEERFAQVAAASPVELPPRTWSSGMTDDPEVIVVGWDYQVHHRPSGKTFEAANIQVARIRDGVILHSGDFHDHLALIAAAGALPQLVAALDGK